MRTFASVVLACALVAPPAAASHPTRCGAGWVGGSVCHFKIGGTRLRVSGAATATGTARVRVWITPIIVGTQDLPLLECAAEGAGSASCAAEIPLPVDIEPGEIVLACRVAGVAFGTYRCDTKV